MNDSSLGSMFNLVYVSAGTIANRLEPGFARKGEAFRETSAPDATYCALMCATTVTGAFSAYSFFKNILSFA